MSHLLFFWSKSTEPWALNIEGKTKQLLLLLLLWQLLRQSSSMSGHSLPTLYPCSLAPMNLVLAFRLILGKVRSDPEFDPCACNWVRPAKRNLDPKCGNDARSTASGSFSLQPWQRRSVVMMSVFGRQTFSDLHPIYGSWSIVDWWPMCG